METNETFDIRVVCEQFGISSRTLRYYEEEGLIESTKVAGSARRRYTEEQREQIRYVVTLRAIGLPVKAIKEYLDGENTLKEIVNLQKARIEVSIEEKIKEIQIMNRALATLAEGKELYAGGNISNLSVRSGPFDRSEPVGDGRLTELTRECALFIVNGQLDQLYSYFSTKMIEYMPKDAFQKIWNDSIAGLGAYMEFGETTKDSSEADIFYQALVFEKMKLRLKFVYNGEKIIGLWMNYMGD